MKKYKFKLDSLLKIREFEEHKVKIELGQINKEVKRIEDTIKKQHEDIDIGYESQNKLAKDGTDGRTLQFYPYFTEGKRRHIEQLENQLWSTRRKYFDKLEELRKLRAKVKVVENLKEKDLKRFKKDQLKLEDKKIDDMNRMRANQRV